MLGGGKMSVSTSTINFQSCLTFQHPSSRSAKIKYRTNRTHLNKWTACGLQRWFDWSSVNNLSNLKSTKSVLLPYNSKITYFLSKDFSFSQGRGWSFFFSANRTGWMCSIHQLTTKILLLSDSVSAGGNTCKLHRPERCCCVCPPSPKKKRKEIIIMIQMRNTCLNNTAADGPFPFSSLITGQSVSHHYKDAWNLPRYSGSLESCRHCRTAESGRATFTPPTHCVPPGQSDDSPGSACNLLTFWQGSVENPITPRCPIMHQLLSMMNLGTLKTCAALLKSLIAEKQTSSFLKLILVLS